MVSSYTLMIQGTSSDAGKTTLVTALCRLLKRQGISVAPFKPQNMALNSAVTKEGGEIGRAQALQALACGLAPSNDMNPVLIKPNSDTHAQVIVNGKPAFNLGAKQYHDYKQKVFPEVLAAYQRLQTQYDVVIVEGAGSPAEINLRDNDIANMGFAEAIDCPVILIADIDRGGVFAQCVGTLELLSPSERDRVRGFVINRFRGDKKLLDPGLDWLEKKTGKPVFGVLPFIEDLYLNAEDALDTKQVLNQASKFKIVVPMLPHISNHTDFDPLRLMPEIDLQFIKPTEAMPPADLIILPGTKNTIADLQWLRTKGWDSAILRHLRFGGKVLGICGGLQMLGKVISDPDAIESETKMITGFGLLNIETILKPDKKTKQTLAQLQLPNQSTLSISGYEIHAGETVFNERPILQSDNQTLGVIDKTEQVLGVYLHGVFDQPEACCAILQWANCEVMHPVDTITQLQRDIDRLADCCQVYLDFETLLNSN